MNKESMDEYADDHPEYTGVKAPPPTKSVRDVLFACWRDSKHARAVVGIAADCGYPMTESEVTEVFAMFDAKYGSLDDEPYNGARRNW